MKNFILFLVGLFTVFMIACKPESELEPEPEILYGGLTEKEILALGIPMEDAVKELSHEPTGAAYVETANQTVEINFELHEWMEDYILSSWYEDEERWIVDNKKTMFDSIPSLGKLIAVYKEYLPRFNTARYPFDYTRWDGEYICTKLEYALAQELIKDDCSTQTRKVVLQIAIEKQKRKNHFVIGFTLYSKRTGIFFMSVILIKEKDDAFLEVIHENQHNLCLKLPFEAWADYAWEDSEKMVQFATDFLSNQ